MTDLGPTGRTKHTEDHREILQARQELEGMRRATRLLGWSIAVVVLALAGWITYLKIDAAMSAPEQERRIDSCATAMASESAREAVQVPIPPCESLSPSERREAAYLYVQREGML